MPDTLFQMCQRQRCTGLQRLDRDVAAHLPLAAVDRYFALMFDNDVSRFAEVFAPSAQLHGLRDGQLLPLHRRRVADHGQIFHIERRFG
jgi:hypothetical protein